MLFLLKVAVSTNFRCILTKKILALLFDHSACVPVEGECMREKGEREIFKAKEEEIVSATKNFLLFELGAFFFIQQPF